MKSFIDKLLKKKMLVLALGLMSYSGLGYAQAVTGQAFIENNNIQKAESDARREAMRTFVEQQCGVKVNSYTEVENFMLVRDRIATQSEGYVTVKKVISSGRNGDFYTVVLDLEVGNKPMELAADDIKGYLSTLDANSNRNGIDIALVGDNIEQTNYWNRVLIEKLRYQGFQTNQNDAVIDFQMKNLAGASNYAEMRRIGREQQSGAKAIIRGNVRLARRAELVAKNTYRAIAEVSCEIIGYESNAVDAVSRYYTAVANNAYLAEKRAQEQVIMEACEELARQAAITCQQETRGGTLNVKTLLTFSGVQNKGVERNTIIKAIQNSGCSVVRSGFVANGDFQVYLSSNSYGNLEELKSAVLGEINNSYPNAYDQRNESSMGSVTYTIKLQG